MNPYETCPVYQNDAFLMRLVQKSDAEDLLAVYSDERAVPYFNSDNCHGDNFHYTTLARMEQAIDFWLWEYDRGDFVRWAIIDRKSGHAIGTVELFHRDAADAFDDCGLLRLDVHPDYEKTDALVRILSLIVPSAPALFSCSMLATKIPPFAGERISAAAEFGFTASDEVLIGGDDGRRYDSYYVLKNMPV